MKETTDIVNVGQYLALSGGQSATTLRENMGDDQDGLTWMDLDRVGVPSGGQTQWTVNTVEGAETTERLEGVILFFKTQRSYWSQEYTGSTPPDCYSRDGITGVGSPGGSCRGCDMAQFGSHPKGDGQACKQQRLIFLLTPTNILPLVVTLPPTSLQAFRKYTVRLPVPYYQAVTRLTLVATTNKGGISYSKVNFKMVSRFPEGSPDAEIIQKHRDSILPHLKLEKAEDQIVEWNG